MMKTSRILAIAVASMALTACSHNSEKKSETEAVKVETITVGLSSTTGNKSYVGVVEESYGSQVTFATVGTVQSVSVDAGQAVHRGQVLATLDRTNAQNAYEIAQQTLSQAKDGYDRLTKLYNAGSLPEVKYVEIQTQLAQAQASERIARKGLDDCVLRAPFDGYVAERGIDVGNNVAPGISGFKIVKINPIKVKVSVPEKEVASISRNQRIGFTVSALGGQSFTGTVVEKGVQADPFSHTYDIKLELQNPGAKLLPGMVASVAINTTGTSSAIVVPQQSVMLDGESTFVWIANKDIAEKRSVATNGVTDAGVIVTSGLQQGDKVIVAGQDKVSQGSKLAQ